MTRRASTSWVGRSERSRIVTQRIVRSTRRRRPQEHRPVRVLLESEYLLPHGAFGSMRVGFSELLEWREQPSAIDAPGPDVRGFSTIASAGLSRRSRLGP